MAGSSASGKFKCFERQNGVFFWDFYIYYRESVILGKVGLTNLSKGRTSKESNILSEEMHVLKE